jgi:hypothetical protein
MFKQIGDSRIIDETDENSESARRGMSEEEFAQQDAQLFRIQSNCSKVLPKTKKSINIFTSSGYCRTYLCTIIGGYFAFLCIIFNTASSAAHRIPLFGGCWDIEPSTVATFGIN